MALATMMANWLAMLASSSRKSSVWRIRSCETSLWRFSATFKISSKCKKAHTSADMKTTHTSKPKLSLQIFSKVPNKFTVKTSTLWIHSSTRSSSSSTQRRRPAPSTSLTSSGLGMLRQTRGSWSTPNSQDRWPTIWTLVHRSPSTHTTARHAFSWRNTWQLSYSLSLPWRAWLTRYVLGFTTIACKALPSICTRSSSKNWSGWGKEPQQESVKKKSIRSICPRAHTNLYSETIWPSLTWWCLLWISWGRAIGKLLR